MKVLENPLFFVFAFTLFVFLAGIWWLLRQQRERTDREQRASPLRESEPTVMELLQEVPPDTIPLDQHGPMSPRAVPLDNREATRQTLRREETISRLALLDDLIAKQKSCIASACAMRQDVTLLEEQLKILTRTREEYYSALKRLLLDFTDGENSNGGNH